MKTTVLERSAAIDCAADCVAALLKQHPAATLLLDPAEDCLCLYRELNARLARGTLDLSQARFFAASEFESLPESDPRSAVFCLRDTLLRHADPAGGRSFFLSEKTLETYDEQMEKLGGIDLAILGIGARGRVAFNEPATPFDSAAHRQKLTKASRRELSARFGGEAQVPGYAYTVGIRTLFSARRVLLFALGEERADPVFRMMYARTDSFVPAAFLQLSSEVDIVLDNEAAARL